MMPNPAFLTRLLSKTSETYPKLTLYYGCKPVAEIIGSGKKRFERRRKGSPIRHKSGRGVAQENFSGGK
jgi:hypothetical protein